jgi:gamma-glutamyl-gamma-aminobutyrate hydrolase PuuD
LVATGWSEDDLIEAVEGVEGQPWMLAVQWHPEEMHADAAAPERGLFRALVERAGAAAAVSVDS